MGTVIDTITLFTDIKYVDIVDVFGRYIYTGFYSDIPDYICKKEVIGIYKYFDKRFKIIVSE